MECRKKVSHQLTPAKGATASGHNLTLAIRRPLDCEPVLDWPIFGQDRCPKASQRPTLLGLERSKSTFGRENYARAECGGSLAGSLFRSWPSCWSVRATS